MKKALSFLLMLCICFSLVACASESVDTQNPTFDNSTHSENETTEPEATTEIRQLPMFSVSLPISTQTTTAEDGTIIFDYSYQSIALIGPEPDVADTVILDFLNHIDSTVSSANSLRDLAIEYQKTSENWVPYFYEIIYRPVRLDQAVLCLYGRTVTFSGAAHPETHFSSINYDLTNGNVLTLTDIFLTDTSTETICSAVIDALAEIKSTTQLYEGYEDFVAERFNKSLSGDRCWHLDANGLTFYFSPYEIGPYASGDISVTIPYSDLVGVLKEDYFPIETENATGNVSAEIFSEELGNQFTQFSEIVLAESGKKFVLYTNDYVRDVTLYTGTWSPADDSFVADDEVFYASSLTPGDGILVDAALNTAFPTLYLTYNSNGETVEQLIMLDNQTSNIKLING